MTVPAQREILASCNISHIFVVWGPLPVNNKNTVLTKLNTEIWEHSDIIKDKSKQTHKQIGGHKIKVFD